jgi:hypothetical protein
MVLQAVRTEIMSAIREKLLLKWRKTTDASNQLQAERDGFAECAPVAATVLVKCLKLQPLHVDPWMERNNQDLGTQRQELSTDDNNKDVGNIARASPLRPRSTGRPRWQSL